MYRILLTLRSPTCIAQRPPAPGQPTESLRFLTGTVIRGALASLLLRGRRYESQDETLKLTAEERDQFCRLFLSGDVVFGNAWPQLREPGGSTQIVPRTAWAHKRTGGWFGDAEPGTGVRDALTALLRDGADALTQAGYDRYEQEFAWDGGSAWKQIEVGRRMISRTALARNDPGLFPQPRGVAADGQLYTLEALETGQVFSAMLYGRDERLAEISALFPPNTASETDNSVGATQRNPALVSIGQGRSRGMGQVELRVSTKPVTPPTRDPQDLAQLARAFTQRAGGNPDETVYLPITLLSDTILRDYYLLPSSSAQPRETLERYTQAPPPPGMILHYAVQSVRWLSGWDELRRIPRPAQLAVQQGSVWVYALPANALDMAIRWWLDIEAKGIGERKVEGFGRIGLLHPFHATEKDR